MAIDALKIRSSISQPFIIAGTPFTLTTTIENAHEDSIEVLQYIYNLPYQVQWILDVAYGQAYTKGGPMRWLRPAWKTAAQPPGTPMAWQSIQAPGVQAVAILQSGESSSYSYNLIVPNWLFTQGGQLVFQGTIVYRYKGIQHTSPFEVTLVVRPPIKSMTIGAIVGSVLGSFARILQSQGDSSLHFIRYNYPEYAGASILAVILATVAVVFSSRRSAESQPVVTIEDFWGGVAVGFLIGFFGEEYFQKLIPLKSG